MKKANAPPPAIRRRIPGGIVLEKGSDDITWALALLKGYHEYGNSKLPRHKYLDDGEDEFRARMALFKILIDIIYIVREHRAHFIKIPLRSERLRKRLAEASWEQFVALRERMAVLHRKPGELKEVLQQLAFMVAPTFRFEGPPPPTWSRWQKLAQGTPVHPPTPGHPPTASTTAS
jgi:hypothetical protein